MTLVRTLGHLIVKTPGGKHHALKPLNGACHHCTPLTTLCGQDATQYWRVEGSDLRIPTPEFCGVCQAAGKLREVEG